MEIVSLISGAVIGAALTGFSCRLWFARGTLDEPAEPQRGELERALATALEGPDGPIARRIYRESVNARLFAGVADGLLAKLASLSSLGDAVIRAAPASSPLASEAMHVRSAAGAASDLVRRVVAAASRPESTPTALDLTAETRDLARTLELASSESVTVRTEIDERTVHVRADRALVWQAVMGICQDVIASLGGREGALVLELVAERQEGSDTDSVATLTVRGEANGRPNRPDEGNAESRYPEFRAAALDRMVGRAGGSLYLDSDASGLVKAVISLQPLPIRLASAEPESPEPRSGEATVLVVDDNALVVNMLEQILRADGYRVLTASSGKEALEIMQMSGASIDLLLSDVRMPKMSGLELAQRVSADHPALPILLMTAFTEAISRDQAARTGVQEILLKPLEMDDLLYAVRRHMRRPIALSR